MRVIRIGEKYSIATGAVESFLAFIKCQGKQIHYMV